MHSVSPAGRLRRSRPARPSETSRPGSLPSRPHLGSFDVPISVTLFQLRLIHSSWRVGQCLAAPLRLRPGSRHQSGTIVTPAAHPAPPTSRDTLLIYCSISRLGELVRLVDARPEPSPTPRSCYFIERARRRFDPGPRDRLSHPSPSRSARIRPAATCLPARRAVPATARLAISPSSPTARPDMPTGTARHPPLASPDPATRTSIRSIGRAEANDFTLHGPEKKRASIRRGHQSSRRRAGVDPALGSDAHAPRRAPVRRLPLACSSASRP